MREITNLSVISDSVYPWFEEHESARDQQEMRNIGLAGVLENHNSISYQVSLYNKVASYGKVLLNTRTTVLIRSATLKC